MRARQCWVCSTKLVSVRQIRFGSSIKLVKFHFIQWLAVLLWCCDTEMYWLSALFASYRTLKSFFASSTIKQSIQIVYGPNKICWTRCFVDTMNWVCCRWAVAGVFRLFHVCVRFVVWDSSTPYAVAAVFCYCLQALHAFVWAQAIPYVREHAYYYAHTYIAIKQPEPNGCMSHISVIWVLHALACLVESSRAWEKNCFHM